MATVQDYARALGLIDLLHKVAGDQWPSIAPIPVVRMRQVRRAGYYKHSRKVSTGERINESIGLHKGLTGEGLREVFKHELAHVIQTHEYGRSDHGPLFQVYARALGISEIANGKAYQGPEVLQPAAKWTYRCADCGALCRKWRRPKWGNVPIGQAAINRIHVRCRYKPNRGVLIRCASEQIDQIERPESADLRARIAQWKEQRGLERLVRDLTENR